MRLTALLLTLLLLAIPAHATEAEPEPASTIEVQTFVSEGGWGTLVIDSDNTFSLSAMGANAHTCSLEGTYQPQARAGMVSAEGLGPEESPCVLSIAPVEGGLDVSAMPESDSCRSYCGVRADFTGIYYSVTAACDPLALGRLADQILELEQTEQAVQAQAQSALAECGRTLRADVKDQLTAGLAKQLFLAGNSAACKNTLAPLAELLAMSEQEIREGYPPYDGDTVLDQQAKVRAVAQLCP